MQRSVDRTIGMIVHVNYESQFKLEYRSRRAYDMNANKNLLMTSLK